MRNQSVLVGVLLIVIGLFFFLGELDLPYVESIFSWQLILIVVGIVLIAGSLGSRKGSGGTIPGVILLGLGIHFLGQDLWPAVWPDHWAVYTFIVSLAFFAQYLSGRDKGTLIPSIVLLLISLLSTVFRDLLSQLTDLIDQFDQWWPILLILLGLFVLFKRK